MWRPLMKNNAIWIALPYFLASAWFLAGVFTRQTLWLILGIITLAAASLLTILSAKKQQARLTESQKSGSSPDVNKPASRKK